MPLPMTYMALKMKCNKSSKCDMSLIKMTTMITIKTTIMMHNNGDDSTDDDNDDN